ncbi:cytochrome P450 71A1 [Artemisia annua]|uniref:Cytochrome P450 71A1 n=1 Tax=Artemisia annua TaxID=35608 RepID=A0A2U1Q2U9_ARTAN|nr:cytochrome P450 71A1 [Artemisia annua]
MEQYAISISYSVLAWLATVALLLFARHFLRPTTKLNLPPGPKPWPIIGNFNLIGSLPHRSIHDLSQKYGQIMHLKFGSKSVVVGSSVEMAKVILKTMDVNFICRPKLAAGKYTTYNYSDITWSPYGPYWRQARKMCIVELFSVKRLNSYEYIRVEETKSLLKELHKSCGGPIVLKQFLSNVSLNVICRIVVGKRYLDESEAGKLGLTVDEFQKMLDELFLLNGVLNIGDWIPWISFIDLQGYVKRMKAISKKFDRFLEHVLNEHEERRFTEGGSFVPKDMVDHLLQIADDPTLDVKLERHGVKGFTQVFFFLSSKTNSYTHYTLHIDQTLAQN